jgi:hypothetical protein
MSIMDPLAVPAQIRSVALNRSGDNIEKLEPANFHLERVLFRKTASLRVISLAGIGPAVSDHTKAGLAQAHPSD